MVKIITAKVHEHKTHELWLYTIAVTSKKEYFENCVSQQKSPTYKLILWVGICALVAQCPFCGFWVSDRFDPLCTQKEWKKEEWFSSRSLNSDQLIAVS